MIVAAAGLALGACGAGVGAPSAGPAPLESRGVPGFDTRSYPGPDAMRAWREASPYRWVGFYLPAPCYTGTSWQGRREEVRSMGWGIALLFVGEQDWPDAGAVRDTLAARPVPEGPRCTRTNLTAERGRADAAEAERAAAAEGFAAGTVVYLDVERVESVSDSLRAYVEAWVEALAGGRYRPGLYAHARNADALHDAATDALRRAAPPVTDGEGSEAMVPLWVARPGGFSLRRGPTESGFPGATIWQGLLDTDETWGGVTLRIDANVASSADPST